VRSRKDTYRDIDVDFTPDGNSANNRLSGWLSNGTGSHLDKIREADEKVVGVASGSVIGHSRSGSDEGSVRSGWQQFGGAGTGYGGTTESRGYATSEAGGGVAGVGAGAGYQQPQGYYTPSSVGGYRPQPAGGYAGPVAPSRF